MTICWWSCSVGFNEDFFTWGAEVPCQVCGIKENSSENSFVEIIDFHTKLEKRICCGKLSNFYRYNDMAKLLVTR